MCSERERVTVYVVTAMCTAFALNLDLFTRVCRKHFKVDTAKGKTPSQIIIIKKQPLCNDVHVRTNSGEFVLEQEAL